MALELDVVFEDDHLLVINKPAGLVVHPAPGHWDDTLVNALVARGSLPQEAGRRSDGQAVDSDAGDDAEFGEDGDLGESEDQPPDRLSARPPDPNRPGIIHRLDKDTSGLIVVAKNDNAHRKLSHALGLRRIERTYAALIWGHVSEELDLQEPIGRNPKNRQQMTVLRSGGRPARTLVSPVARWEVCDLVRAKLYTGRTHQIRVHLTHAGHPVVGDPVYRGGGYRRMTGAQQNQALAVDRVTPRQALHAASLRFAHPETREWLEFQSDWPADLRPALAQAAGDETLLARPKVLEYLGFRA